MNGSGVFEVNLLPCVADRNTSEAHRGGGCQDHFTNPSDGLQSPSPPDSTATGSHPCSSNGTWTNCFIRVCLGHARPTVPPLSADKGDDGVHAAGSEATDCAFGELKLPLAAGEFLSNVTSPEPAAATAAPPATVARFPFRRTWPVLNIRSLLQRDIVFSKRIHLFLVFSFIR